MGRNAFWRQTPAVFLDIFIGCDLQDGQNATPMWQNEVAEGPVGGELTFLTSPKALKNGKRLGRKEIKC